MKAESNLGGLLGKSARLISNTLDSKLRSLGLTSQQWTLLAELSVSGSRNQTDLAKALLKNKASICSLVNYLEAKNCVERKASIHNRRNKIVVLTPRGHQLFQQSKALAFDIIAKATKGVAADDLAIVEIVLCQLIKNLEKSP